MEAFTEQVSGRPIASLSLDSWIFGNVMLSLKWLWDLWALTQVIGFTEKIDFIRRLLYCGVIGSIYYIAIFSVIHITVCNFYTISVDPIMYKRENPPGRQLAIWGQLNLYSSAERLLADQRNPKTMATIMHPQACLLYRHVLLPQNKPTSSETLEWNMN